MSEENTSRREHTPFLCFDEWQRFHRKINKTDNCWEWTEGLNSMGYGVFWLGKKTVLAHRISYKIHIGVIPEILVLDHLCSNRKCVNPAHLEAVTTKTNVQRSNKTRIHSNTKKTHCYKGHPLSGNNLVIEKSGSRRCRICKNNHNKKWRKKNG